MSLKRKSGFYLILMLCLCTVACAGSLFRNYGRINPNEEVTRALESYQVNSDFHYYVSGAHLHPNALIGLHKDYRLDPAALWREVDEMTPAKMKEIVDNMKIKAFEHRMFQHGFEMSDPKGRPIGIWYSILEARTFLRMSDDGTVRIDTPPLDLYMKRENDSKDDN
jgi:hypothetical protein